MNLKKENPMKKVLGYIKTGFSFSRATLLSILFMALSVIVTAETSLDRTTLPIAEPQYPYSTTLDVRDATPPPRFEVKAPGGAPNVLLVLVDDLGFAGTGSRCIHFALDKG
jgi:arylsulfatase